MQEKENEIKYEVSVRFLRNMLALEKLTLEQARTAEQHLRKVYGVIVLECV